MPAFFNVYNTHCIIKSKLNNDAPYSRVRFIIRKDITNIVSNTILRAPYAGFLWYLIIITLIVNYNLKGIFSITNAWTLLKM